MFFSSVIVLLKFYFTVQTERSNNMTFSFKKYFIFRRILIHCHMNESEVLSPILRSQSFTYPTPLSDLFIFFGFYILLFETAEQYFGYFHCIDVSIMVDISLKLIEVARIHIKHSLKIFASKRMH